MKSLISNLLSRVPERDWFVRFYQKLANHSSVIHMLCTLAKYCSQLKFLYLTSWGMMRYVIEDGVAS